MLRSIFIAGAISLIGSSASALTTIDRVAYQYTSEIFGDFPNTQGFHFRYEFDPSISSPENHFEISYQYQAVFPDYVIDGDGEVLEYNDFEYDYSDGCVLKEGQTCSLSNLTATFVPGRLDVVVSPFAAGFVDGPCIGLLLQNCVHNTYVEAIFYSFPWDTAPYDTNGIPYRLTYGAPNDPAWDRAPAVVPEPAAWALLIMGFGAVGATLRRRRLAV